MVDGADIVRVLDVDPELGEDLEPATLAVARPRAVARSLGGSGALESCSAMARLTVLQLILGLSIVSTATHYTHNFVAVDDYPGGGPALQVAIVLSWPALTAIGLYGYRLYKQARFREAHICLLLYAPLGLLTPAHFLSGEPDVAPIFYATIFTDGLAGLAIVGFVAWSAHTTPTASHHVP
jgi:hypothetical protein